MSKSLRNWRIVRYSSWCRARFDVVVLLVFLWCRLWREGKTLFFFKERGLYTALISHHCTTAFNAVRLNCQFPNFWPSSRHPDTHVTWSDPSAVVVTGDQLKDVIRACLLFGPFVISCVRWTMRRDYRLKKGSSWRRVSKIMKIELSENDITGLRVLDAFCWCGVSNTGVIWLEDFSYYWLQRRKNGFCRPRDVKMKACGMYGWSYKCLDYYYHVM